MEGNRSCHVCPKPATQTCLTCELHLCKRHICDCEDLMHEVSPGIAEFEMKIEDPVLEEVEESTEKYQMQNLFKAEMDLTVSFKLLKWFLNIEEATQFMKEISEAKTGLQVIGIYGCLEPCLKSIRSILNLTETPILSEMEAREGIFAYYRPEIARVCLLYKTTSDGLYKMKPYPEQSRESVFIRLLLDVCNVIVCCPSQEIYADWYYSDDRSQANPFSEKRFESFQTQIQRIEEHEESRLEEVKVYLSDLDAERLFLPADSQELAYDVTLVDQDREDIKRRICEDLKSWSWKTSVETNPKDENSPILLSSRLQSASFQPIRDRLVHIYGEACELLSRIEEVFNEHRDQLDNKNRQSFDLMMNRLQCAFPFKTGINHGYVYGFRDTVELSTQINKAKEMVLGTEPIYLNEFVELLTDFVKKSFLSSKYEEQQKFHKHCIIELLSYANTSAMDRKAAIVQTYQEIEAYIISFIDSAVDAKCVAVRSLQILKAKESLVLHYRNVTNKIPRHDYFAVRHFLSLSEDMAFAFFQNEDQVHAVQFSPKSSEYFEIQPSKELVQDVIIASGSTERFLVTFLNSRYQVWTGALNRQLANDRLSIQVYSEGLSKVTSAAIIQRRKNILLLDQHGHLYQIDLNELALKMVTLRSDPMEEVLPIRPKSGELFLEVQTSQEKDPFIFLRSDVAIEVYDLNFRFLLQVPDVARESSFKSVSFKPYTYILIKKPENTISCFRFLSSKEELETQYQNEICDLIPGNPIIDMVYYALFKFGSECPFTQNKPKLFIDGSGNKPIVEKYINGIELIHQSFSTCSYTGSVKAILSANKNGSISCSELETRLFSRTPVHLASIQEGSFIPFHNGFDLFQSELSGLLLEKDKDFITSCVEHLKFGSLEEILNNEKQIKVISILGRQSSGKSYLLNRLFGTRFDVASCRCTDGIWVSLSRIENQAFLVLDCEGLFSQERTMEEESKLCIFLAAISDVTILNQDLSFNRNVVLLFERFTNGLDRLKGTKLFKGQLEVAIRDVATTQCQGTVKEVKSFINSLLSHKRADFLLQLFGGNIQFTPYHNFTEETLFRQDVNHRRQFYLTGIKSHWESGRELKMTMKGLMAQLYVNDASNCDDLVFKVELADVRKYVDMLIQDPKRIVEMDGFDDIEFAVSLDFAGLAQINFRLSEVKVGTETGIEVFSYVLEGKIDPNFRKFQHNAWYQSVETLINAYFLHFKEALSIQLQKKNISGPHYDRLMGIIEQKCRERISSKHSICLRQCSKCNYGCTNLQNHSSKCDCSTSHSCPHDCEIDGSGYACSEKAGHLGKHLCDKSSHTCESQCGVVDCNLTCTKIVRHEGEHCCGKVLHPCNMRCGMSLCQSQCLIDVRTKHEVHDCGKKYCLHKCEFPGCSTLCADSDHFHEKKPADTKDHFKLKHFCQFQHECSGECQEGGACAIKTTYEEDQVGDGIHSKVFVQTSERLKCQIKIDVGFRKHRDSHSCQGQHRCSSICPDCGAFCSKNHAHPGDHASVHREKALGGAEKACCDSYCLKMGRGHQHRVPCSGGLLCSEVTLPGKAVHAIKGNADLVECEAYWRTKGGWEPPMKAKDPKAQESYSLCPYPCRSVEHLDGIHHCQCKVFHTKSVKYQDHVFPECHHSSYRGFDICFLIDCIMPSCFPQVNEVIKEVLNRFSPDLPIKFAVIGYSDHGQFSGAFEHWSPIKIYPHSKNIESFEKSECKSFLNRLTTHPGAWIAHGRAMVDALHAFNGLKWSPESKRMCVIITDESPNGYEFNFFSGGCACNLSWRDEMKKMLHDGTLIRLVTNRADTLAYTNRHFSDLCGKEAFRMLTYWGGSHMIQTITEEIAKVIENQLEFLVGEYLTS